MNVIAAVNSDWGIGYNNAQAIVISEDRQYFKEKTSGCIVIAGRKTFESIGGPLPNRKNIILTGDRKYTANGIAAAHSIAEVLAMIAEEDADKVFVIGGGSIYKQFLPMCSYAYITKIEATPSSDTFLQNLDNAPDWTQHTQGEKRESDGVKFSFNIYKRKQEYV